MKNYLVILMLSLWSSAQSQSKQTIKIMADSKLLVKTIYETRDSATLESLFASAMTHRTADGRIETREEAIQNIMHNPSAYARADMRSGYGVAKEKDSTTVKYFYRGREIKPDGSNVIYTANMVMVWVKEKKKFKLLRLETIKVD